MRFKLKLKSSLLTMLILIICGVSTLQWVCKDKQVRSVLKRVNVTWVSFSCQELDQSLVTHFKNEVHSYFQNQSMYSWCRMNALHWHITQCQWAIGVK
jgi:hypothetical protein